jgi:hypothetical protein
MKSIPCDVVILPEPILAHKAILASQKLENFNSYYTLEDGKCYPHMSIYMLELKIEDIPKVEDLLGVISRNFSQFTLEAYRYYGSMGYIDVEFAKTTELVNLQKQVIQALGPVRNGMRDKDRVRMQSADGVALKNFKEYGYKYVGELFRPHISLTCFKEDNDDALSVLDDIVDFNGTFPRLGIFEMGDHGTCIREIKTFNFSG